MQPPGDKSISRIGLLSPPIGNGNLGDEATVAAVIQNIRCRYPNASIYAFAANPADTRRRHNIPAFPITRPAPARTTGAVSSLIAGNLRQRLKATLKALPVIYTALKVIHATPRSILAFLDELRFIRISFKRLKGTDILIVTGSGVLSDHFGGPFNFPYTIFKWSLLARVAQTRLVFFSVGAGPLRSPISRWLVKYSLSMATYRSSRDVASRQVLEDLGVVGETPVYPDLAISLRIEPPKYRHNNDRTIVGINAFPHFDPRYWPVKDPAKYRGYITTLASVAAWLIHNKYKILLLPTQVHADTLVLRDIKDLLVERGLSNLQQSLLEPPIDDVAGLTSWLGLTSIVIATRFHGILLSFLMNKPVLALSNHHKMSELMRDMGQYEYLLDINTLTCESLIERFTLLESNSEMVRRQVSRRISEYRRALDRQYDILTGDIRVGSARRWPTGQRNEGGGIVDGLAPLFRG